MKAMNSINNRYNSFIPCDNHGSDWCIPFFALKEEREV